VELYGTITNGANSSGAMARSAYRYAIGANTPMRSATCSTSFGHMIAAGLEKKGSARRCLELVAWKQAAFVIERAQRMAMVTLRRLQRDLRTMQTKLLTSPPNLKLLPPPTGKR